jgi:glycogen synthase kinase 3 beta
VAIKTVFQDKNYKNRELQIIEMLDHPNCLKLYKAYYTNGKNKDEVYLNIVTEYVPENLYKYHKSFRLKKQQFPNSVIRVVAY